MSRSFCFFILLVIGSGCGGSGDRVTTPDPIEPPVIVEPSKNKYQSFESGAVRPVAISMDGQTVFVTNIPNHSLDIFNYNTAGELELQHSVKVGIEPVAVAVRNEQEVWVTNHISDSVSIVNFNQTVPYVSRTLLVGDEPRDIVFAKGKAFIATAHRGQHRNHPSIAEVDGAGDPLLHEPGISRADVWVFDPNSLTDEVGGKPVKIMQLFGDSPRALAVSPDESKVYAAVLNSGNQTTAVHEGVMCYGYTDDEFGSQPCSLLDGISSPNGAENATLPGGRTAPGVNKDGVSQPWTSMIVKFDPETEQWKDSTDRNFTNGIRFNLPDKDVFVIDTGSLEELSSYSHVGTTIFNIGVNPTNGNLLVTNTESNNATRFEGPGIAGGSTVQGNIAKSRLTHIDISNASVAPRELNRHIDYSDLKGNGVLKEHSVATPTQLEFSANGQTIYVAALGSNKVAVYKTEDIQDDSLWDYQGEEFDSIEASDSFIEVDGGPSGLLLNQNRNSLLVYTRFDNALVSINLENNQETQRLAMFSPEPDELKHGRFMLYDAKRSSSNGEASCAGCHIYADSDQLAWNLGNPDASNGNNPQPFPTSNISRLGCDLIGPNDPSCQLLEIINGNGDELSFASMKGPMFTQTLRGMSTHGHMHWRGDRSVGYFGNDIDQTLDEKTSFKNFIVAFEGLLGMNIELPNSVEATTKSNDVIQLEQDIDKFADFVLRIQMPPNPIKPLNNQLSSSAQLGQDFFLGERRADGAAEDTDINGDSVDGVNCEGCHGLDPAQGFYGTRGEVAHGGEIQILKVPQLRNLYTRVGMFGLPDREGFLPSHTKQHQGDQIRGFGFLHDGATDQLVNFLRGGVFDNGEDGCPPGANEIHGCEFNFGEIGIPDESTRLGLVDYLMEFDSDLAPIVGQQITLNSSTALYSEARVNLLMERAEANFVSKILGGNVKECDLISIGVVDEIQRGYLYDVASQDFQSDIDIEPRLTFEELKLLAQENGNSLTFTCQVPGMGLQMALDHDLDGILNGDEES